MSGDLSRSNAQKRNAIQRRKGPSFFFTTDIDAAQGVEDGVIVTSVVLGHSLKWPQQVARLIWKMSEPFLERLCVGIEKAY